MTKKTIDTTEIIQQEAEQLLEKLQLSSKVSVSQEEVGYIVNIDADDSGVLIGYHGETLAAFQLILSLVVSNKVGAFSRIIVNVGDYREKREEKLKEMAYDAARRAKETNQEVVLSNLSSWQRRIIHMTLAEDESVTTESQGEEPERYLVIKPR